MVDMGERDSDRNSDLSARAPEPSLAAGVGAALRAAETASVQAEWPLAGAAQVLLLQHLSALLSARQAVARGDDVEALHQLRVACRRMRSLLSGLAQLWPKKRIAPATRALRQLARGCGRARDLDVELQQLTAALEHASPAEEQALRWLWARAAQARHAEQPRLAQAVARFDEEGWPRRLSKLFATRPIDLRRRTQPAPQQPLAAPAPAPAHAPAPAPAPARKTQAAKPAAMPTAREPAQPPSPLLPPPRKAS